MNLEGTIQLLNFLGSLMTTLTIVFGGGFVLLRLGRALGRFEEVSVQQNKEISELKDTVKSTNDLMVRVAVQHQFMDDLSARLGRAENTIDDLRRGEGKILPLNPRTLPNER